MTGITAIQAAAPAVLALDGVRKEYEIRRGLLRRSADAVRAVDGVSFEIGQGDTLGLVGESGCGKSTLARMIMRLIPPSGGSVMVDGQDVGRLLRSEVKKFRRKVQMVFQDPYASLNPRITAHDLIAEPLRIHGLARGAEVDRQVVSIAAQVGLPAEAIRRYPHEFSGGQRQRIAIARALAVSPRLIVADEPVSALDVSVRAQVLNLMADLQQQRALSYLFISHDIAVVAYVSRRIAVMYRGAIVELGPMRQVLREPLHPYTKLLLQAVPVAHPRQRTARRARLATAPEAATSTSGCRFADRCPYVMPRCRTEAPSLRTVGTGTSVACYLHAAD
jgi:peptide/nickel transport system ATP-binding protein/oligopeptide transport system ATP-binding protein